MVIVSWKRGAPHVERDDGRTVCGVTIPEVCGRCALKHVPGKLCRSCKRMRFADGMILRKVTPER